MKDGKECNCFDSERGVEKMNRLTLDDLEVLIPNAKSEYQKLHSAVRKGVVNRICFVDGDGLLELLFPKERAIKYSQNNDPQSLPVIDECPNTFFIIFANVKSQSKSTLEKNLQDSDYPGGPGGKDLIRSLHNHPRVWTKLDFPYADEIVDYRLYNVGSIIKQEEKENSKHHAMFQNLKYLVLSGDGFLIRGDRPPPQNKNAPFLKSLVEYMGSHWTKALSDNINDIDHKWFERGISLIKMNKKYGEFLKGRKSGGNVVTDVDDLVEQINHRHTDEYHQNDVRRLERNLQKNDSKFRFTDEEMGRRSYELRFTVKKVRQLIRKTVTRTGLSIDQITIGDVAKPIAHVQNPVLTARMVLKQQHQARVEAGTEPTVSAFTSPRADDDDVPGSTVLALSRTVSDPIPRPKRESPKRKPDENQLPRMKRSCSERSPGSPGRAAAALRLRKCNSVGGNRASSPKLKKVHS